MLKRENHIEIDRRKFYKTVLALVVPMASSKSDQRRRDGGRRHYVRRCWRKSFIRRIFGRTDSVYYDIVPVRSDLRSDGAHGSVLGKRRPGCD